MMPYGKICLRCKIWHFDCPCWYIVSKTYDILLLFVRNKEFVAMVAKCLIECLNQDTNSSLEGQLVRIPLWVICIPHAKQKLPWTFINLIFENLYDILYIVHKSTYQRSLYTYIKQHCIASYLRKVLVKELD
mgnify:CR=1 FL=1